MGRTTKRDLRKQILDLNSSSRVATDSRSTVEDLERELEIARILKAQSDRSNAIKCDVVYREEDDGYSWKLVRHGTDEVLTKLKYGDKLPLLDTVHPTESNEAALIVFRTDKLKIVSGDLPEREKFDARRVYKTASKTNIVYKRVDSNLVIVWSYKRGTEIGIGSKLELTRTGKTASATAAKTKKLTQRLLAAYLIANNPDITNAQLTNALIKAFPEHQIGARHGGHYRSLSASGRLPEPPDSDPREW